MRVKKFTCGITFFVTPEMYQDLKQLSDEKQIAISEVLRGWITDRLIMRVGATPKEIGGKHGGASK
jgi:hypothetical protein